MAGTLNPPPPKITPNFSVSKMQQIGPLLKFLNFFPNISSVVQLAKGNWEGFKLLDSFTSAGEFSADFE